MNDVKDFGPYSVKNVKNFMGRDTYGFNCTLYRDGKKVATCIDDGNGGEIDIQWSGPVPRTGASQEAWKRWHEWKDNEEKILVSHIQTLPKVKSEYGDGGDLTIDEGWFVTELVNKYERDKEIRKMRRQCQSKTLYRTPDQGKTQYYIHNAPFVKQLGDALRKKYGEDVELFNEVFEQGGIPSVLKG